MSGRLHGILVLLSLSVAPASAWKPETWPAIVPLHQSYRFSDANHAVIDLKLLGTDQRALYRLECHNYSYESDPAFDYSGDFECKLTSLYVHDSFRTLRLQPATNAT